MTPEQAADLRKPFGPESIGKLPRVTCKACRDSESKNCAEHRKSKCGVCGNWITSAHIHLDYVGHAEITDRLIAVDPCWGWEPVAFGQDGLPHMGNGGLWIRLTVAGVTRLGFGSADGKTGPDAVKEMIGDALRNAAMRFGVGLDLWGAKFKDDGERDEEAPRQPAWDPHEQEMLRAAYEREIAEAKTHAELGEVATRIGNAKKPSDEHPFGKISPATSDRLLIAHAEKRAELNGKTAEQVSP